VRAAEETSKSLLRLKSLINYSPSPIVIMDDKGRIMELSAAARRILGLPPDDRVQQQATRLAPPEIFKKVLYVLSQPKNAAPSLESIDVFEYDGGKRYFESRLFPIHAPSQDEKLFGYLAIDVTERIEIEHALKASEEKYSNYIKNAPYAVFIIDEQGRFLEANHAITAITGYAVDALLHMSFKDITPLAAFSDNAHRWKELQKAGHLNIELNYVHKSGLTRWWIIDAVKLSAKRFLCFASDTTNKKQAETELLHLSYHDYLTGLFNRRFFEMELKRFDIERCLPLSVFFADINGLKLVNDTFGHAEGDRLIIDCAMIINDCCRVGDTVARVGGDEFGIIMPKTDSETALGILTKIQDALSALDLKVNNGKYAHSVSLGFGIKRSADEDVLQILHMAEGSMYQRKLLEHNSSHSAIIASIKATMIEKDHDTGKHAERLVELSKVVAKALKLSQADQDRLELLATLHDIGKVGISDYILTKPGKLSIEEWAEVKRHPEIGYRIAISTPELIPVAESILCHHERWDGGGYPQGLMGERIPLFSRILAIVDAYDAMTHDRPYRKAISSVEAIAEINLNAGKQFDPQLVRVVFDQKIVAVLKTI
jgi:diguanylate cyclase (GGDEF)-like protein/PAS domain S-box-containing protein